MGDITKNISAHELRCKCGDPECNVTILPDDPIIQDVQGAVDYFERECGERCYVVITSAARCFVYNRLPENKGGPGSNDNSQHPRCVAMDIKIHKARTKYQISPELVAKYFADRHPSSHGIGIYKTFTHIDRRTNRARWDNR